MKGYTVLVGGDQILSAIFDLDGEKAEFMPMYLAVITPPDHLVYQVADTGQFVTVMESALDRNIFTHVMNIAAGSVTTAFCGAVEFIQK